MAARVLVGRTGVKLPVRLKDGRVIHRHLDHVRSAGRSSPVCPPHGASRPSAGYPRSLVTSQCMRAASPQPVVTSPPAVNGADLSGGAARYVLRDRASLRQPDRLSYTSSDTDVFTLDV